MEEVEEERVRGMEWKVCLDSLCLWSCLFIFVVFLEVAVSSCDEDVLF